MFRPNLKHHQTSFFGIQSSLPPRLKQKLLNSSYQFFFQTIFCNIKEENFSTLYSDKASRPNAPINCLVAALILKHKNNWSYEELFEQIEFNLLTKTALGLDALDDIPFDDATIYNFQNRLLKHQVETGEKLMEQVFDNLTKAQLKELKIKTDIQRSDSLMASSNIRGYSRLQLLVEVLLRLWRIMDETDKAMFESRFSDYLGKTSGQYIYKLKAGDLPHEIAQIAQIYHFCKTYIMPKYEDSDYKQIFERVYTEHFTEVEERIIVKPSLELNSSCLQSPDDLDATFREKRKEEYRGQSINIVETASQENPLNLITDIAVNPNNEVSFEIKQTAAERYRVNCFQQSVESQPSGERYKALFNKTICQSCQLDGKCPAVERKSNRVYYFAYEDYLRNKRIRSILDIPKERRKIRPNVEATVHEFSCRLTNGKLRVRGAFKAKLFAYSTAIAINFGRIFRYKSQKPALIIVSFLNFVQIVKERLNFSEELKFYYIFKNIFLIFCQKMKTYQFSTPLEKYCF